MFKSLLFVGLLMILYSCSKSDELKCELPSIPMLGNSICLSIEHDGLTLAQKEIIIAKVSEGIMQILLLMPIDNVQIRIVKDPNLIIPEIGLGGYNPNHQELLLAINTSFQNLEKSLEENFIPLLAHEIHHAKRRRSVGYGSTLLEAVISEGLADHFSIELSGITAPPWTMALSNDELQQWIDKASSSWNQPYDHAVWFFGTDPGTPKWTGYSIGFELVKRYLLKNPTRKASELHNEPASSFKP